jgi:thiol-disulfide isomerase/thioredoxin
MKKYLVRNTLIIFSFSIVLFSCQSPQKEKSNTSLSKSGIQYSTRDTTFNTNPESVLKDFSTWWSYYYSKTNLAENFIGYNDSSKVISKEEFLNLLQSGNYAPIKTMIKNGVTEYKLYRLGNNRTDIANIIKQETGKVLFNFYQQGKPLPSFRFEDLNGNIYTPENTKGKIIVLKSWFIHCGACVAEFPELNEIVEQYKDRKDILFISLASDAKPQLENFLKTKKFNYAVVPDQLKYMAGELKVTVYPTHIIVGKDGKIKIIVTKAEDFLQTLRNEAAKT